MEFKLFTNAADKPGSFKQQFILYVLESRATEKADKQKVAVFLNIAEPDALGVYKYFIVKPGRAG